jgi:hypothetical protein
MRIMRTLREQFVERVEAFLVRSGMRPTDFGRESLGDPSFITHLRRGRSPSLDTADRVNAFIDRLEAEQAKRARGG